MPDDDKKPLTARPQDVEKPPALPGIYRYSSFTDLRDRMTTPALNRVVMVGVGTALALDVLAPVARRMYDAAYCYECRACYATQEHCPASITFQAELTLASRTMDYRRFLLNRGLLCQRCGNCNGFCVQRLNLARLFGKMGIATVKALRDGKVPLDVAEQTLRDGLVGRVYLDDFYAAYRERGGRRLG